MTMFEKHPHSGFTLVELMVAIALTGIVSIGIYMSYVSFTTSFNVQEQVVEQHQNLRIGLQKMVQEIRMAGCDPVDAPAVDIGFLEIASTSASSIHFTMDKNGNGLLADVNDEDIKYELTLTTGSSANGSFTIDRVDDFSGTQPLISNVDALNFVFLDVNRAPTATANDIRYVQIALVVRTTNEDYSIPGSPVFPNLQGTTIYGAQTDNFRRRLLTAEVTVRNMFL